jgi:hypothetical protein
MRLMYKSVSSLGVTVPARSSASHSVALANGFTSASLGARTL